MRTSRVLIKIFLTHISRLGTARLTQVWHHWKWEHDQPYSRILIQLTQNCSPTLNIDDDGFEGIRIEAMAVPVGIWEIDQIQPFGVYEELFKHGVYKESESSYRTIQFRRVPYTQFEWTGTLQGYELKADQIVLLDREVERLILKLDNSIDIRCLDRRNLSQAGGYGEGLDNFLHSPAPRRERNTPSMQIRNVLASLIASHPELGEAVLKEPYAVKDKLVVVN